MATQMRKTKSAPSLGLWAVPDPPKRQPAPEPKQAVLSPEALALIEELKSFEVKYHPETVCKNCKCPLSWPLKTSPGDRLCCRCYPRAKLYGEERHERILALFPRGIW